MELHHGFLNLHLIHGKQNKKKWQVHFLLELAGATEV